MWAMLLTAGVNPTAAFGVFSKISVYGSPRGASSFGYFSKLSVFSVRTTASFGNISIIRIYK